MSDAASVDDPLGADAPIELGVGVVAHYEVLIYPREDLGAALRSKPHSRSPRRSSVSHGRTRPALAPQSPRRDARRRRPVGPDVRGRSWRRRTQQCAPRGLPHRWRRCSVRCRMLARTFLSALPRTKQMLSESAAKRSRTSPGIGPATTSPPTTMRSGSTLWRSARTASRAGRLPWTS